MGLSAELETAATMSLQVVIDGKNREGAMTDIASGSWGGSDGGVGGEGSSSSSWESSITSAKALSMSCWNGMLRLRRSWRRSFRIVSEMYCDL